MTDQSQQKQRKRKQQIVIIYMMMLPLLLIAICCGAQVGILTSGITTFGDGIRPLENADYSPWDQFRFGPIREDAITQAVQDGNRAAGVFIVTPTVAPTGTGTATVPPTFTPTPTTTSTPTDADSGNAGNAPDGEDTTITDGDDGGNGTTGSEEENAASTDVAADVAATEISVLATDNAEAETTLTAIAEATDVPTEQPTSTAPPATATTALVTPQPVNTSVPGATSVPAQPTSTDVPNDPVQNDPDAPVAAFDASENLGTVTFTNRSSGDITSYAWNFGDGNTSSSVSPVHAYTTTGTFTAQLTVTGPGGSDTATVIITVLPPVTNPTTTLALLLLPSDLTPAEGDTVTYTLQVSNSSSETASNIALNLNFPTGLSAGSATVSSGGYGGSVWSIPTLGGGTSASLQIPVQVAAGTAGTALTTVATVSAVTPANTGDISVSSTLNVQAITSTDLEIDISASTLTPLEGAPLILTGRVTNNGAVTATGIQVNAALATGLTFVSSSGPGTYNSGVWTLPSLASGATVTIDLQVTVDPGTGGSTITQNANLASIDQTETDATNNNDTVLITVTAATADLSLVMIPPAGSVNRRDANDITFQVTNNSASPSSNVELTGTLPGGVSFVSSADCSAAGSNLTCTPVNLAAGATQTYTVTVRFNDLGQQVFTGSVTADTTDPNTANNTATLTADVMSIRACPDDGEPNIGAPNGVVCRVTSTLVLDMGGSAIVTQPGAYDFAYYESFSFGATDSVAVDLAVVSVGTSPTGPWFEVFNWGNDVIDLNSSIGQAGYGNGSEPANLVIPTSMAMPVL
ncbi:MAG: PKD domain-containing protein [Chloroflexota bacterium]